MRYKSAHATPPGKVRTLPVPVTLAAVMTAAAGVGSYFQTRTASAAARVDAAGVQQGAQVRGQAQALLDARGESPAVSASRTLARAALLQPLVADGRYASIDPDHTPAVPASLTADAPTDTRATVKLKRRLAEARVALERSGAAYASAKANATEVATAVRSTSGTLADPTRASLALYTTTSTGRLVTPEQAEADLRLARVSELHAANMHRENIAHATTLIRQVREAVLADARAAAARVDAAIARGDVVRLADGTTRRTPAIGTPIRGNGWTLTPQVRTWAAQALTTLYAAGYPAHDDDLINLATIIYNESGGDPGSKNDWDSNAAAGIPSFGLMQTIGPTFEAYALPGHTDPSDPQAQIMAGARYALDVYKGLANVPGVRSLAQGGPYLPY